MTEDQPLPPANRAGIAFTTFLKALVRVLLICLAAILLGGLIYFAFVAVYQQAVLPARENANRISLLETGQAQDALLLDQRLGDFHFLGQVHAGAGRLLAVAQGSVEDNHRLAVRDLARIGGYIGDAKLFYIYGRYVVADAAIDAYALFVINTGCFSQDLYS